MTTCGLELPEGLSFEAWAGIGETLCRVEASIQWWVGDWWAYGEHRYGERKALVERLRAEGRDFPSFQTCMNAGSVCQKFETYRRREVLTWAHHVEVASLGPAEQDELLDQAERDELSTRELRAEVSRRKAARALGVSIAEADTCTTADLYRLVETGARFGCIYADPPWLYDNQGTRAATGNHYEGMTVEQLCALPVGELAAPDAHLHLWTTNGFLFDCQRILRGLGLPVPLDLHLGEAGFWHRQLLAERARDPADGRARRCHALRGQVASQLVGVRAGAAQRQARARAADDRAGEPRPLPRAVRPVAGRALDRLGQSDLARPAILRRERGGMNGLP